MILKLEMCLLIQYYWMYMWYDVLGIQKKEEFVVVVHNFSRIEIFDVKANLPLLVLLYFIALFSNWNLLFSLLSDKTSERWRGELSREASSPSASITAWSDDTPHGRRMETFSGLSTSRMGWCVASQRRRRDKLSLNISFHTGRAYSIYCGS